MKKRMKAISCAILMAISISIPVNAESDIMQNVNMLSMNKSLSVLSPQEAVKNDPYIVIDDNVNIRRNAGLSYTSLGQLIYGETVYRLDNKAVYRDGYCWIHVQRPLNGTKGWVADCYLRRA
ncbi:MAG: SH3 domain-containing protein [Lachnospiraceae bacterium]|jgi:uncharacterized protein YgiM (DUF1202 family)|nr:SH3 domain-containing protein [Lachnospiraceae bacterium]